MVSLPSFTRDFSYTYEGKTLVYTVTDEDAKTFEVKAGSPGEAGNEVAGVLEIPSNVYEGEDKYKVTSIGDYAFNRCRDMISVTCIRRH